MRGSFNTLRCTAKRQLGQRGKSDGIDAHDNRRRMLLNSSSQDAL